MRSGRSLRTITRPALLLAAAAVVLLAGCVRSDLTVTVNDDGSGTYTAIVAINPKAIADLSKSFGGAASGQLGDDPCKEIRDGAKENQSDLPSGAKIENYSDGDYCGVKITAPFAAGDNPSQEIEKMLGGIDSSDTSGIGLETFSIKKSGDTWTFEATPQGSGDSGSLGGTDTAFAKQFLQGAYSIVRIKLPGRVVEKDSNPDAIDGNGTLIWNLNLTGETRTLKARTEPGSAITNKTYTDAGKNLPTVKGSGGGSSGKSGGSSSKVPLIIGGLVVVAAIVGFVLWRRSKGAATPAVAGAPAGAWTPPAAPDPTSAVPAAAPPMAPPAPAPMAPTPPPAAVVPPAAAPPASPAPTTPAAAAPAPGEPQWDAARNAYILWDAGSAKWLQYDNAAGAWKPIDER